MGDLNSDLSFKRNKDAESHFGKRLLRILRSYGMKCIIKEPTRISDTAQTLIDLIIVSHPERSLLLVCPTWEYLTTVLCMQICE